LVARTISWKNHDEGVAPVASSHGGLLNRPEMEPRAQFVGRGFLLA
jgi:hypothetical protein